MQWRLGFRWILILQLSVAFNPGFARADDFETQGPVPNPAELFHIPTQYLAQKPGVPAIPPELWNQFIAQLGPITAKSQVVFQEVLILVQGLFEKTNLYVKEKGLDALFAQVSEKRDMTSLDFDILGVGKAELKAIGHGYDQRLITTVRHNSGQYFIFADRSQFSPDFLETPGSEPLSKNEISIRKCLSGIIRRMAAEVLLRGDRSHIYEPLVETTGLKLEQVQEKVSQELDPLSSRYQMLKEKLDHEEISQSQRKSFLAEMDLLENQLVKKQNSHQGILSKIIEMAVIDLGNSVAIEGYETTVIMHDFGRTMASVKTQTPPKKGSFEAWKKYWESIYLAPHMRTDLLKEKSILKKAQFFVKGDIGLATFSVASQVPINYISLNLAHHLGFSQNVSQISLAITTVTFGMLFGTYAKTINHWLRIGSSNERSAKQAFIGTAFGYGVFWVQSLLQGKWVMKWENHLSIWTHQFLKGPTSTVIQEIPQFNVKTGDSLGNKVIFGYDTEIRKADLEPQLLQIAMSGPRLLSLFVPGGKGVPVYFYAGAIAKKYLVEKTERFARAYQQEQMNRLATSGAMTVNQTKLQAYQLEAQIQKEEWDSAQLWDAVKLLQQTDRFGNQIKYRAEMIAEANPESGLTRLSVRILRGMTDLAMGLMTVGIKNIDYFMQSHIALNVDIWDVGKKYLNSEYLLNGMDAVGNKINHFVELRQDHSDDGLVGLKVRTYRWVGPAVEIVSGGFRGAIHATDFVVRNLMVPAFTLSRFPGFYLKPVLKATASGVKKVIIPIWQEFNKPVSYVIEDAVEVSKQIWDKIERAGALLSYRTAIAANEVRLNYLTKPKKESGTNAINSCRGKSK